MNVIKFPHRQFPLKQSRLNVNINDQTRDDLKEAMVRDDITVTEAVRRLVPIGAYVLRALRNGYRVQLVRDDGRVEPVAFNV